VFPLFLETTTHFDNHLQGKKSDKHLHGPHGPALFWSSSVKPVMVASLWFKDSGGEWKRGPLNDYKLYKL